MAISRERKEAWVSEYTDQVRKSSGIILAHYTGLSVARMEGMRRRARDNSGEIFVVKNTLLKSVLDAEGIAVPEDMLTGPTLAVFCHKDFQSLAKLFRDFVKESEEGRFIMRGAVIEGHCYNAKQAEQFADMPSREQLLAQVLGTINAPASQTVGVVASGIRQVLNVLQAYVDKLEGGSPAEAAA